MPEGRRPAGPDPGKRPERGRLMSKSIGCLLAIGAVVLLVVLYGVGVYNGLVGAQQAVEAQWSQVEGAYQRRADLIPNLVNTVKGASEFERDTLTRVTEARS